MVESNLVDKVVVLSRAGRRPARKKVSLIRSCSRFEDEDDADEADEVIRCKLVLSLAHSAAEKSVGRKNKMTGEDESRLRWVE